MTYNIVINDYRRYRVEFLVEENEEMTFCTITDTTLGFVVAFGKTLLSPDDEFDYVIGMRNALQRALETPPVIFSREDRGLFWESFWDGVDLSLLNCDGFIR